MTNTHRYASDNGIKELHDKLLRMQSLVAKSGDVALVAKHALDDLIDCTSNTVKNINF